MSGFVFSSMFFVAGFVVGYAVRASGGGNVGPAPVPGPKGDPWSALMNLLRAFGVLVRAIFGSVKVSSGGGTVEPALAQGGQKESQGQR
jgi:hypothetical protein